MINKIVSTDYEHLKGTLNDYSLDSYDQLEKACKKQCRLIEIGRPKSNELVVKRIIRFKIKNLLNLNLYAKFIYKNK